MSNFYSPDRPTPQEPSPPGSTVDLHGMIRVIVARSWLIATCVVVALIIAAVYAKKAPRIYEALATVQVQQEEAKIMKADQVVTEDMHGLEILTTVAEKFSSLALLEQVMLTNNLLPSNDAFLTNGSPTPAREEAIKKFAASVKTTLRRNTRLIDITVRNTDPRLAAQLANSLIQTYLEQDALAQFNTTEAANKFLEQQSLRLKQKLEASEQALQDYRKKVGSVSLEQAQDIISPQLQDLSKRLTQAKATLLHAWGDYQDSLKMSNNVEALLAYSQVATDPDVVEISTQVARHENDFVLVRERYREKNPKYIMAAASLSGLRQQLGETVLKVRSRIQENLRIAYQNALTAQQGLQEELRNTESNAMQLSDAAVHFNVLSREVESEKSQYDSIINRLGETQVAAMISPERIRIIQPASPPGRPKSPKITLVFALAIFVGLGAGLGLCFLLESVNTSIRTVEEAEQYLALPVLGSVPRLQKNEVKGTALATADDKNSGRFETFRTLRTTLSMLGREETRRTYLFTSALPNEGKTFVSVNYAVSLAQQGLRTLLLDLDLRRPMLEEFFTGKRGVLPGMTDYLLGNKKLDQLSAKHADFSNLHWIAAGSLAPNPLELLSQSDLKKMLDDALVHYDRVVIDTVPLLPVSDALLLVDKVQTVVLVVQGARTPRDAVQRSVLLLKKAGAPLAGVVLNLLPNRFVFGYHRHMYRPYGHAIGEPLHSK